MRLRALRIRGGLLSLKTSRLSETLSSIDEGILIERTQDVEAIMADVKWRRDAGAVGSSEMRHVGRFPNSLVDLECGIAGIHRDDSQGRRELIMRKVQSGEWAAFQIHEGGY